ncbi:hypothetical protein NIES4072_31250 [Nostoc commune NIES-4072]|uniref:Uncharacterized protein n=1 Tax=Nostoc commune NIES-4072 TaxID=2005467 RepID=A0A2R5FKZ9_NOSCO|nr:hypothetical protein [Nostoc commune]BBD69542.1 hypothetical protein NIES4070_59510 [Nostoc commune HK-02]GBG19457.1 hypothetical protein NIES4072_31250 [Nostoc commune NIES-4072]
MSQPVTLYSPDGKRSREIAAIDAPGWIRAGWTEAPVTISPVVSPLVEVLSPATPAVEPTQKAKRNDVSRNAVPEN